MTEIAEVFTKAVFLVILIRITYTDLTVQRIYDNYVAEIVILSAIGVFTMPGITMVSRLSGAICISFPMFLITLLVPGAFGGGDIKLAAAGGLFLGYEEMLLSVTPSVMSAGIYCVYLLLIKKAGRKSTFPFGPFLCLGMAATLMW